MKIMSAAPDTAIGVAHSQWRLERAAQSKINHHMDKEENLLGSHP
jgi:hypothetical protein